MTRHHHVIGAHGAMRRAARDSSGNQPRRQPARPNRQAPEPVDWGRVFMLTGAVILVAVVFTYKCTGPA